MNINPIGNIKLITSPFKKYTDSNKLKWVTQVAQREYFNGVEGTTFTTSQYTITGNGVLSITASYNSIKNYNYIVFQNDNFYAKKFYCFIKNIKQINNSVCEVYFDIDSIQTFAYDGSKTKYLSKNPDVAVSGIFPVAPRVKAGSTIQFRAMFSDDKHITTLVSFRPAGQAVGWTLTSDGKLTIDSTVSAGTIYVVIADDPIYGTTVSTNVTIIE